MYVCICNAITDGEVRSLASQGCQTAAQVYRSLECRPQCCKCVTDIRRLIDGADALELAGEQHC